MGLIFFLQLTHRYSSGFTYHSLCQTFIVFHKILNVVFLWLKNMSKANFWKFYVCFYFQYFSETWLSVLFFFKDNTYRQTWIKLCCHQKFVNLHRFATWTEANLRDYDIAFKQKDRLISILNFIDRYSGVTFKVNGRLKLLTSTSFLFWCIFVLLAIIPYLLIYILHFNTRCNSRNRRRDIAIYIYRVPHKPLTDSCVIQVFPHSLGHILSHP